MLIAVDIGKGQDNPYRDIAVPERFSLYRLAETILKSFDFYFDHCFGFFDNLNDPWNAKESYELFVDILDVDAEPGSKSVKKNKVKDVFRETGQKMLFYFDYGDDWHFPMTLLKIEESASGEKYPKLIAAIGKAPEQYRDYEE